MKTKAKLVNVTECAARKCHLPPVGMAELKGGPTPLCTKHLRQVTIGLAPPQIAPEKTKGAGIVPFSDVKNELAKEQAEAVDALDAIQEFAIQNNADQTFAADLLAETKGNWKRLEGRKQAIVRPLNDALKEVRALFAPPQDHYAEIETILKAKLLEFAHRATEENQARLAAAQSAHEAGDADGVRSNLATLHTLGAPEGVSVRTSWDFEVVDLQTVPRQFLNIDRSAVKIAIREGAREIEGLRIFQVESVASVSR